MSTWDLLMAGCCGGAAATFEVFLRTEENKYMDGCVNKWPICKYGAAVVVVDE